MLWSDDLHTKYLSICGPFPQQDNAEIPVLDGDVLLDRYVCLLPDFEDPLAGRLLEDWNLGGGNGSWTGHSRVRAVFVAELLMAST